MTTRTWMGLAAALLVAACGSGGGSESDSSASGGSSSASSYTPGPGPQGGAVLYSDLRSGKKLVLHQRDILAVTPVDFRDRLATMEAALDAFDGVFLSMPVATAAVMKPVAISAATIAADLEPLYALKPTRLKYNFAVVTVPHDLDVYDDWSQVLTNLGYLARVARDAGLVGIVIDNESIAGLRVDYPYDLKYQTHGLEEYYAQTQLIGKKIMQAITTEFPDAAVVVLRGPAGAEPKSPTNLVNRESDSAQLLGSFFVGFVEAKGARALLIDGGTDYGLRTAEQFSGSNAWRKTGLASADTNSAFIAAALRTNWPSSVSVSFGLRELDGAHGNLLPNDTALFAGTVRAAMGAADTLAWASFDLTDMTKAAAADPWPTAARRGKAAFASPALQLVSATPASGTGLMAQYFSQIDESELAQTVVDPYIDNIWSGTGPTNTILAGQNDNFSVVWTGYVEAPVTGTYTIYGTTDDGMQIFIGGKTVIDAFFFQAPTEYAGTIDMVAGTRYPIKIRYFEGGGETEAHLWWLAPGGVKEVLPTQYLYPMF